MSHTLVQKGLELFDDNINVNHVQNQKSNKNLKKNQIRKGPIKQSEITEHIVTKKIKDAFLKNKAAAKKDNISQSIKHLKRIDRKCAQTQHTDEVMNHHKRILDQKHNYSSEKKLKKSEEKSAFTDEDFNKLNEEWLKLY